MYHFIGLFGLFAGGLATMAAHRWYDKGAFFNPFKSICPDCGSRLSFFDSLPIVGYLIVQGRCRHCAALIHWRYPVTEISTALLWTGLSALYGQQPTLFIALFVTWLLTVVLITDCTHQIIPNEVIVLGILGGLAVNLYYNASIWHIATNFLLAGLPWAVYAVITRGGLGGGDVKLAVALGLFFGWLNVLVAYSVAMMASGIVRIPVKFLTRASREEVALPMAPFIVLGILYMERYGHQSIVAGYQMILWSAHVTSGLWTTLAGKL